MTLPPPVKETCEDRLSGDLTKKQLIDRILRVDHAGEYGAVRIYKGQLAVFGEDHPMSSTIKHMLDQEEVHLDRFNKMLVSRQARPSAFSPLWHVTGFMLGAGTALLGQKAAMACTEAVEEVIDEHYADQIKILGEDETALRDELEVFRQEEAEHRKCAIENGAQETIGHPVLYGAIKAGVKAVIKIAERF